MSHKKAHQSHKRKAEEVFCFCAFRAFLWLKIFADLFVEIFIIGNNAAV